MASESTGLPTPDNQHVESMAAELQLPEEIVQHIQSFLGIKEAARSSVLSKSWHSAWSTRPILILNEEDFGIPVEIRNNRAADKFINFARKTVRRYEELDRRVNKFKLEISAYTCSSYDALAYELIVKVAKLGVNELDLTDLAHCVLPAKVFAARSLMKLTASEMTIDPLFDGRVLCSRLISLILWNVSIGDGVIRDILSGCPLIETLHLGACCGLTNVNVSKMENLVDLYVVSPQDLYAEPQISLDFKEVYSGSGEFRKLHSLCLKQVCLDDDVFFSEFSSLFPCVEDLTLIEQDGYADIRISSNSLKYLTLHQGDKFKKAHFDVPNIRKFEITMLGVNHHIPSLTFSTTASNKWESRVGLSCSLQVSVIEASWLLELREFLTELSFSKISLHIEFGRDIISVEEIPHFPTLVVENLMVGMNPSSPSLCPDLVGALFRICRPNYISQTSENLYYRASSVSFLRLVHQTLICQNSFNSKPNALGIYDPNLEYFDVELFNETLLGWESIPFEKLLDALETDPYEYKQIRIRFIWPELSIVRCS